jgi:hypothetical protein
MTIALRIHLEAHLLRMAERQRERERILNSNGKIIFTLFKILKKVPLLLLNYV